MPYPHLRSDERSRNATPDRSVGIVVFDPSGKRFFFPGGDEEMSSILMNMVLSEKTLTHPATSIEFGYTQGVKWVCEKRIKAPPEA